MSNIPTNPIDAVGTWMSTAGQLARGDKLTSFSIGMMCEEFAETLAAVGGVDDLLILSLKDLGTKFKEDRHDISGMDKTEFLDGVIDTAWTSIGALHAITESPLLAFDEVTRSNFSKFVRNGDGEIVAILDANGKVIKGEHFFRPNLKQFVGG